MKTKKITLCSMFIWLICHSSIVLAWRPFVIEYRNFKANYSSEYSYCNGSLLKNSAGHDVMNILFTVEKRMPNVMANLKFYQIQRNENRLFYIDHTVNVCQAFVKPNLPSFVFGVYRYVTSVIDVPLRCPVEVGVYHATEAGVIEEELPPYVPLNTYQVHMKFFLQNGTKAIDYCWLSFVVKFGPNKIKRTRTSKN